MAARRLGRADGVFVRAGNRRRVHLDRRRAGRSLRRRRRGDFLPRRADSPRGLRFLRLQRRRAVPSPGGRLVCARRARDFKDARFLPARRALRAVRRSAGAGRRRARVSRRRERGGRPRRFRGGRRRARQPFGQLLPSGSGAGRRGGARRRLRHRKHAVRAGGRRGRSLHHRGDFRSDAFRKHLSQERPPPQSRPRFSRPSAVPEITATP